jgi:predicted dithiol-disulfide oxidoreductase (DUF899 family)
MLTTFVRSNGVIRHFWSSEEWHVPADPGQNPRHVDFMWPLWGVLNQKDIPRLDVFRTFRGL